MVGGRRPKWPKFDIAFCQARALREASAPLREAELCAGGAALRATRPRPRKDTWQPPVSAELGPGRRPFCAQSRRGPHGL
eukprot:3710119-Alexandrium_andersonii.AAC.1